MMIASDLKDLIRSRMDTEQPDNVITAQLVFGTALKDYLEKNCEITYGWVGVSPPPPSTPDPVVTFTAKPTWITFPLAPALNFNAWILSLGTIIQTAILIPDDDTFLLSPLTLGIIPIVGVQSGKTDPDEAMLDICTQIINGIKLMINPVPATGTHTVYTGSATMSNIK